MSADNDREFLVTKLRCSECGEILQMTYEEPKVKTEYKPSATGEPSGGFMVQQFVFVRPCRKCKRHTDRITDAVRTLIQESEGL